VRSQEQQEDGLDHSSSNPDDDRGTKREAADHDVPREAAHRVALPGNDEDDDQQDSHI
jgi:hypothetical protein